MPNNIVLIGPMGSGKSTVAKKLSEISGWPVVDTDTLVETSESQSIRDIFKSKGESYFRAVEAKICQTLPHYQKHIIATGGGIILDKNNRETLKKLGPVIYLESQVETLLNRLKNDTTRPLLSNTNLKESLENMLETRHPIYKTIATQRINTDSNTEADIAKKIWQQRQNTL